MLTLALTGIAMIVVTAALIDWAIWFHKWFDWHEAEKKRPKQIPLDDAIGTENYRGPLG